MLCFREINGQTPAVTPATKTHLQQFEVTARKSKCYCNINMADIFWPRYTAGQMF